MPKRRSLLLSAGVFLMVVIAAAAVTGIWLTSPLDLGEDHFVEIEHGTGTRAIANQLAQEHLLRSPWAFLLVRLVHRNARLQAGEYVFGGRLSAWQIFDKIRLGEVFYEEVTIPEGSNIFDIAGLLQKSDTVGSDDFLVAAKDSSSIRDLDPTAHDLEGYLFPSTYRLTRKTTAKELCRMMTTEFRRQWSSLPKTNQPDIHRIVTLASLVEKESALRQERPLVAAVFLNRLRASIPLQCDPTTVYAALLDNRYRGVIHKSDLASANPYNTYKHVGLPPGPIANPGADSLRAALAPASTKAIYFVAKGDGTGRHTFSETLSQHEAAVARYRKTLHQ